MADSLTIQEPFQAELVPDIADAVHTSKDLSQLKLFWQRSKIQDAQAKHFFDQLSTNKLKVITVQFEETQVGDETAKAMGLRLSACGSLETVKMIMYKTNVTDVGGAALGAISSSELKDLDIWLQETRVGDMTGCAFGQCLEKSKKLERVKFNLYDTELTDDGGAQLISGMVSKALVDLSITLFVTDGRNNGVGDKSGKAMATVLEHCPDLKYIWLGFANTAVSDVSGEQIGVSLAKCKKLEKIHLDFNARPKQNQKLQDSGCRKLVEALKCQTSLLDLELRLAGTHLGDLAARALGNSLGSCVLLKKVKLYLHGTKLTDSGGRDIALGLSWCKKLDDLYIALSDTIVADDTGKEFASAIAAFSNLRTVHLDFGGTHVSDESLTQLDAALELLSSLIDVIMKFDKTKVTEEKARGVEDKLQRDGLALKIETQRRTGIDLSDTSHSASAASVQNGASLGDVAVELERGILSDVSDAAPVASVQSGASLGDVEVAPENQGAPADSTRLTASSEQRRDILAPVGSNSEVVPSQIGPHHGTVVSAKIIPAAELSARGGILSDASDAAPVASVQSGASLGDVEVAPESQGDAYPAMGTADIEQQSGSPSRRKAGLPPPRRRTESNQLPLTVSRVLGPDVAQANPAPSAAQCKS